MEGPKLTKTPSINTESIIPTEELERRKYEEKIAALGRRLEILDQGIHELEAGENQGTSMAGSEKHTPEERLSRRDLIKRIAMFTLGTIMLGKTTEESSVSPKTTKKTPALSEKKPFTPKSREGEKTAEDEIEDCKRIIKNEQYEEIINNPYLVSALYYSEQAVEKMKPPHQNSSQKIIWNVYPFITKQFRENYFDTLRKIIREGRESASSRQSLPLDIINFGKNLEENHLDAIDLFIKEGSPIYSMSNGLVVLAENGWEKNNERSTTSFHGGNTVIIFNPDNETFYRYAHMEKVSTATGMILSGGEQVGVVGHTGIDASEPGHGEHLHFEINKYDREKGIMVPSDVFELKRKIETLEH